MSKVCFWLLQNNYRVLIAACDTFRSGAVEQLRVHARNLKALQSSNSVGEVELFERGYGKDAAGIAQDAISYGMKYQTLFTQPPGKSAMLTILTTSSPQLRAKNLTLF